MTLNIRESKSRGRSVAQWVVGAALVLMLLLSLDGLIAVESSRMAFDDHFTGRTMRFDYYHSGVAGSEEISLDKFRLEGPWPGSRTRLLDDTNMGKYLFEVVDSATNRTIYSRGFASIYGEWETTGEASDEIRRTFHESQRFPETSKPCQVTLKKRADDGSFREIYSTVFDPASRFVDRSPLKSDGEVWAVFENGEPAQKVDVLVLGDGYTSSQLPKYRADVKRLVGALFATEPFHSRQSDFNVWAIDVPSQDSGISNPRGESWKNTSLGLSFNAFDTDRYVLTMENEALREIAGQAPYDALIIIFNNRKYGGGGIFNLWATCSADTKPAEYVFVHEFGHSFGGLADEYYTSQVAYENFVSPGVEPWEPNITALLDPEHLKWKDLVEDGIPIPTPWEQDGYDKASHEYQRKRAEALKNAVGDEAVEKLFDQVSNETGPMLQRETYAGKIGAFEGAGYQAKGLYRPAVDCIMFTRNPKDFCKVCSRGIERVIDLYSRP